jgi:hypothetical protein
MTTPLCTDLVIEGEYTDYVFDIDDDGVLMIEFDIDMSDAFEGIAVGYMNHAEALRLLRYLEEKLS